MTKDEYLILYEKWLSGSCSREELEQLEKYRDEFRLLDLPWDKISMGDQEATREAIRRRLRESTGEFERAAPTQSTGQAEGAGRTQSTDQLQRTPQGPDAPRSKRLHFRWQAAAALLLLLFIPAALYLWLNQGDRQNIARENPEERRPAHTINILPGGDKARLTLADGSTILLEEAANGTLREQGHSLIRKKDGLLVYEPLQTSPGAANDTRELHNTIATPRGGQFQVLLPDGSRVWLNAASSLRFPTAFRGTERKVELEGEAYFEIAHNRSAPFVVVLNGMEVQVLGTRFNVNAYDDEKSIRTTLVEGSVRLRNDRHEVLLKPGQQASLGGNGQAFQIESVNTETAVSWKNDYFQFEDEDVYSIMRKLARWYDVDIEYQGNLRDKNFSGAISRFEHISEVLQMLELTGAVHFSIEGRRIIVMP